MMQFMNDFFFSLKSLAMNDHGNGGNAPKKLGRSINRDFHNAETMVINKRSSDCAANNLFQSFEEVLHGIDLLP
jgi:hypothetical protein